MPQFKLRGEHPAVSLFRAAGHPESLSVEPGETVTVSGRVLSEGDDVVVVGTDTGDARGWPLSVWELVPEATDSPVPPADAPEGK